MKEKLLISACLLGENCKYSGGNNYCAAVEQLREHYDLIPVCPERDGVTAQFRRGAELALEAALQNGCRIALFKERSPSCGCGAIYDGSFTGTLVSGDGVTAELLQQHHISIFGESRIDDLLR